MWEVKYYETERGVQPAKEFVDSLPTKMKAKAAWELVLLEKMGSAIREPYSVSIGNGLFELRVQQASDIARVFYFFVVGREIILTNGFIKKTQKAPASEIALALRYKADYERRSGDEI
jgi:phage-related protein